MSTRRLLKRLQLSLNHDLKRLNVSKVPGTITTLFLKGVAWGWFVFLGIPPMLTTISLIPKCEQLYLLFTSIKISISMLVWKSSGCSLRKYITLCTHIIVIAIPSQKLRKTQKTDFFILFHFQHPHIVPNPYWCVLKMAFHIVFQVWFMFPEAEILEQAHSGVTRT